MELNEIEACSQTFDDVKEELETIERVLASRLGIPVRQCRLALLQMNRAGQLEEDSVVADWYEAYQSYLNWTRDDSWGRPPGSEYAAEIESKTTNEAAQSGLAAFCRSEMQRVIYVACEWRSTSSKKPAYAASSRI